MKALKGSSVVFYLHRVGERQADFYPEGISKSGFEASVQHLLRLGFGFPSLKEAYDGVGTAKGPGAVLTVDDGFSSVYHEILPIIRKHALPLTVFVIGKCIDNRALAWNHKLIRIRHHADDARIQEALDGLQKKYSLCAVGSVQSRIFSVQDSQKDRLCDELWDLFCPISQEEYLVVEQPFLSLAQMRELAENNVEFALHSQSHADFGRLSYPDMRRELIMNREALSEAGFTPSPFFAFPYGRQCDDGLLPALCRDASLKACLGFRYRYRDNRQDHILWQRISLEQHPFPGLKELVLRPGLRFIKDSITRN
jgi:peptidoglycan/xylan/chitin deacetylase (PgdA/CDA1 family)